MKSILRFLFLKIITMDSSWTLGDWKPSVPPNSGWERPSDSVIAETIALVRRFTKELIKRPYNPEAWLQRSKHLLLLGYPELAAGDAFKARRLCDAALNARDELHNKVLRGKGMQMKSKVVRLLVIRPDFDDNGSLEASVREIRKEASGVLVSALTYCRSMGEALFICKEASATYPDEPRFKTQLRRLLITTANEQTGGFIPRQYPWMPTKHFKRSPEALEHASKYMEGISGGNCTIGESTFARRDGSSYKRVRFLDSDSDSYGMIAKKEIPAGTAIIEDTTVTSVVNIHDPNACLNCHGKVNWPCFSHIGCTSWFCSLRCRNMSVQTWHSLTCRGKLDWVQDKYKHYTDQQPRLLLLLRFFATSIAEKKHPLEHEATAVLHTRYDIRNTTPFTLEEHIISPMRMLGDLGVDVFADARFDTWVLLTLWHKMTLNVRTARYPLGGWIAAVNPCASLINHSCEPNAASEAVRGGSTIRVIAKRDIAKGEEIYLSYLGEPVTSFGVERAAQLTKMFSGPCKCASCKPVGLGIAHIALGEEQSTVTK